MKHPKPWKVVAGETVGGPFGNDWEVQDARGHQVLCFHNSDKALALEIVRAVNAHEALVGALEESIQYSPYKGESEETPFLRRARQALTLAKEPA